MIQCSAIPTELRLCVGQWNTPTERRPYGPYGASLASRGKSTVRVCTFGHVEIGRWWNDPDIDQLTAGTHFDIGAMRQVDLQHYNNTPLDTNIWQWPRNSGVGFDLLSLTSRPRPWPQGHNFGFELASKPKCLSWPRYGFEDVASACSVLAVISASSIYRVAQKIGTIFVQNRKCITYHNATYGLIINKHKIWWSSAVLFSKCQRTDQQTNKRTDVAIKILRTALGRLEKG